MIIYKWTNLVNGKIYIGQSTKTLAHRTRMHVNSANAGSLLPIHCAIRKYSPAAFRVETIATAASLEILNNLELDLIASHDCQAPKGYNLKNGGDNHSWHPDSIEKARKSAKARTAKDGGAQIKAALAKGRETLVGKAPWNKGKKASDQAKANQSLSHMGQTAWNKGVQTPDEVREKQKLAAQKRAKPVLCIETGISFASVEEASRQTGISPIHIKRLIKSGRKHQKTGFSFKFC